MALRAAGHGLRTCILQFIKNDPSVGELAAASALPNVAIHQTGLGFLPPSGDPRFADHRAAAQQGLQMAEKVLAGRQCVLLILDEICLAVARGLVDGPQVEQLLAHASPETCIVLTGRGATPELIALADTVTEMLCIKHGMQTGWADQAGVER